MNSEVLLSYPVQKLIELGVTDDMFTEMGLTDADKMVLGLIPYDQNGRVFDYALHPKALKVYAGE